jgi:Type II restriction endonuclease EcoO109I
MTPKEQKHLLQQASTWFSTVIMENHRANTEKLADLNEFKINPFLHHYLAAFLTGEVTPQSLARVLILPRVLGTSINTSFGTAIQKFTTEVLRDVFGSTTDGIDIEFTDALTGQKTFAQVKLGPNTINKDDVESIHGHFKKAGRLAKTNNAKIGEVCLAVGVLYGQDSDLSGHYKALQDKHRYKVYAGADFWHRLTGAKDFYEQLIAVFANVAIQADGKALLQNVEDKLSAYFNKVELL